MSEQIKQQLLKNKKAVEEINRHRWIESEKAGYDIGFDTASMDWLEKFSTAWMQYHMPKSKTANGNTKASKRKTTTNKTPKKTKTRAKTK